MKNKSREKQNMNEMSKSNARQNEKQNSKQKNNCH
jgi:hypothetical protein